MGFLNRLRRRPQIYSQQDSERIGRAVERVLRLSPQLGMAPHCLARLEPALAKSLQYVGDLVDSLPPPRLASPAAWSTDPYIRVFFGTPDDIPRTLSRSTDLRAFLEKNGDLTDVYAVLGMAMLERHVLGVVQDGDTIRRDVIQTTLSFTDHRIRICGRTEADLRQEIMRRLLEQLVLDGLARIAEDKSRRESLEQNRALYRTRLQLLERQGAGMRSVLGAAGGAKSEELARLKVQMAENERELESMGIRTAALARALDLLCAVLEDPGSHVYLENRRYRVDRKNVVQPDTDGADGDDLTLQFARIPTTPPQTRAFTLVRFPRNQLLPAADLYAEAARLLIKGV